MRPEKRRRREGPTLSRGDGRRAIAARRPVATNKYNTRSQKLFLPDLPTDVLENIFSRLPSEIFLLGAIAKVSREFREIALHTYTKQRVQHNFMQGHLGGCEWCLNFKNGVTKKHMILRTFEGRLPCIMYTTLVTKAAFVFSHINYISVTCSLPSGGNMLAVGATDDDVPIEEAFEKETALHVAASQGYLAIVQYFIEGVGAGLLAYERNLDGKTALHRACENG
eukprot:Rmarinus@m.3980